MWWERELRLGGSICVGMGGGRVASGLSRSLPCFGVDNRGVSPALAALRINRAGAEPGLRHL